MLWGFPCSFASELKCFKNFGVVMTLFQGSVRSTARQQMTGVSLVLAEEYLGQLSITGNRHTNGENSTIANEMIGNLAPSGQRI
jgi:hypothetical protein